VITGGERVDEITGIVGISGLTEGACNEINSDTFRLCMCMS